MSALALDIGTYSIKAISGKPGANPKIDKVVEVFNSTGIAVPTDDGALEKLATLLETVIGDNDLPRSDVRLALPETVVSTKVISIPPLSDAELASAVGWQAEQHIPIPPEELSLQYQVLFRPDKKDRSQMRVLLIGSRKQLVERYVGLFHHIGVEPAIVETHMLAVIRSLQFTAEDPTTMIVHLGASSMDLCVVHQGEPQFVVTHLNGGQLLTRALERAVGLDAAQAEQYKRTYGMDEQQFQGKVRSALLPAVSTLVTEMRKAIQFYVNQHPQAPIQRIVLSGGSAVLPHFIQYVTGELGAEVLLAAPFASAQGEVPSTINHAGMTVCMGLLLRDY
jgi:type IV pilus assembly protein PilM